MTDEERETLRAKLILLETDVLRCDKIGHTDQEYQWAVIKLNTSHFRFERRRDFYATEDEALAYGLMYMLSGEELLNGIVLE